MKSEELDSNFYILGEPISINSEALIELIKGTLAKKASLRFKAAGFSMYPFIKDKDVLMISSLDSLVVGLGRVVSFIHPQTQRLIVHRVVGRKKDFYLIKGDNSFSLDGSIPKENILGYVSRVERNNKVLRFGLGKERFIIAFLNRYFSLFAILCLTWKTIRPFVRRFS